MYSNVVLDVFHRKKIFLWNISLGWRYQFFLVVCEIQVLFKESKALINEKNGGLSNSRYGCTYRLKVILFQSKLAKSQPDPFLYRIILLKVLSSFFSLEAQTQVLMQTSSWCVTSAICLSNFVSVTGCSLTWELFSIIRTES